MLYFRGASLNTLLKNAIGFSCPFMFFYNRIASTVCSDAKENMKKSLVNLGLIRTGVRVSACFTSSKDFLASVVHLAPISFFYHVSVSRSMWANVVAPERSGF